MGCCSCSQRGVRRESSLQGSSHAGAPSSCYLPQHASSLLAARPAILIQPTATHCLFNALSPTTLSSSFSSAALLQVCRTMHAGLLAPSALQGLYSKRRRHLLASTCTTLVVISLASYASRVTSGVFCVPAAEAHQLPRLDAKICGRSRAQGLAEEAYPQSQQAVAAISAGHVESALRGARRAAA